MKNLLLCDKIYPMHLFLISWKFKLIYAAAAVIFPIPAMLFAAFAVIYYSLAHAAAVSAYCDTMGLSNAIYLNLEERIKFISDLYYNNMTSIIGFKATAVTAKSMAGAFSCYLLIAALILIVFHSRDLKNVIRNTLAVSLIFITVGVLSPVLSYEAYSESLPVIGKTIFKHDHKTIYGTISKLFSGSNYFFGSLIFIFSILIPALKVVLSYIALEFEPARLKIMSFLKTIGKWSMADVFTVAVLLAYLALDHDKDMDAAPGPGIYFFAGYCLLSMAASELTSALFILKKRKSE